MSEFGRGLVMTCLVLPLTRGQPGKDLYRYFTTSCSVVDLDNGGDRFPPRGTCLP